MIIIFEKLNQEQASDLVVKVAQFFRANPRRRVCRTNIFKIRRGCIKEDILFCSKEDVRL